MTLEQLWAGWRSSYVASAAESDGAGGDGAGGAGDNEECVLCRIIASDEPDEDRGVIAERRWGLAIINAFPYASGHLMVVPRRHVPDLPLLAPEESAELWGLVSDAVVAIRAAYRPDGLNLGMNLGRAAGAGIAGHIHAHVLPRWVGDTNFMTTTASVRVIPEPLTESYARLRAAWPGRDPARR